MEFAIHSAIAMTAFWRPAEHAPLVRRFHRRILRAGPRCRSTMGGHVLEFSAEKRLRQSNCQEYYSLFTAFNRRRRDTHPNAISQQYYTIYGRGFAASTVTWCAGRRAIS